MKRRRIVLKQERATKQRALEALKGVSHEPGKTLLVDLLGLSFMCVELKSASYFKNTYTRSLAHTVCA